MLFNPPPRGGDDTECGSCGTLARDDLELLQANTTARILANEERIQAEIEEEEDKEEEAAILPEGLAAVKTPFLLPTRSLEIRVNGLKGELCRVNVDPAFRVRDVKSRVATATKMPIEQLRLFIGSDELRDQDFVQDVTPPSSPLADVTMLRIDPEWQQCLQMVSIAGMQLAVVPPRLRSDRAIALAAVRQNGAAFEYACETLRADCEVVLAAVQDCGRALAYASPDLQADPTVVRAAVLQNGLALQHAGLSLRADPELVLDAVRNSSKAFQFADADLLVERDFVLCVVREAGLALEFASMDLRSDIEVVVTAVRQDGLALEYASEELRAERSVVWEAVQQNGLALWDAAEDLKHDPEIMAMCKWG